MSDPRQELYGILEAGGLELGDTWIDGKKESADKGEKLFPIKRMNETYRKDKEKFLSEEPISKIKKVSKAKIRQFFDKLVRLFGSVGNTGEYFQEKGLKQVIDMAKPLIEGENLEDLPELMETINNLSSEIKTKPEIQEILEKIKEKTMGVRLYFSQKQPNEEFFKWLSEKLGGIVVKEDFISGKTTEKVKIEGKTQKIEKDVIETDKMSIVFPSYNRVSPMVKNLKDLVQKINDGEEDFFENDTFSSANEMLSEGRPRPLVGGVYTTIQMPIADKKYGVKPFDAIVLRDFIKFILDTNRRGGTGKENMQFRQFIPTRLSDREGHFPENVVFPSGAKNLLRIDPLFELMMTQSIGGEDWFDDIKKLSQVQKTLTRTQIENLVIGDLLYAYQKNLDKSELFNLDTPTFLTKDGNRLEGSDETMKKKIREHIREELRETISEIAVNTKDEFKDTVGISEYNQYQEAILPPKDGGLGIEELFTFTETTTSVGIKRYIIRNKDGTRVEISNFYKKFLEQLKPTKATEEFKEEITSKISVQEWLAGMDSFVESALSSIQGGNKLYEEKNLPTLQTLSSLTIEHLLEMILTIDERFDLAENIARLYQEIDKAAEKKDWDEVTDLLYDVDEHCEKMFEAVSIDLQKSFEIQLENLVKRTIQKIKENKPYSIQEGADNASLPMHMFSKLQKEGFIVEK